ncbi:carboxylate-amine ligase [Stieleria varia]|uniref:Putative glutamate--cysteine ligase 2 n=1 Tax=Stieleria varia TaxID=2528005 RepID=A0A5C6ATT3_9BACT|nr:glutamate--cysteine ligase [Stieleria varia]TWU02998.1 Carboxylate-amine ligase YbdK [Stieleria varia]
MPQSAPIPTIGVEEEYQLVCPQTGALKSECQHVMDNLQGPIKADIQNELFLNTIEMASPVCQTLDDVRTSLNETRAAIIRSAEGLGFALASAATNPLILPDDSQTTPKDRYHALMERFQQIARDMFIFGCHVHVAMPEKEMGVAVMNRSRRWLPFLLALTTNSPFWNGHDTGYASFRREMWTQWPMAGPPPHFESVQDYQSCVSELVRCGAIKDESFIYWDIRLPTKVPTIEFRGADVLSRVEETVAYAGLVRAVVMKCEDDEIQGLPVPPVRHSVLTYAMWHAARFGMHRSYVDPATNARVDFPSVAESVLQELGPVLDRAGDRDCVERFIRECVEQGTGADRQRKSAGGDAMDLVNVVRQVIKETKQPGLQN